MIEMVVRWCSLIVLIVLLSSCFRCSIQVGRLVTKFEKRELMGRCRDISYSDVLTDRLASKYGRDDIFLYCPVLVNDEGIGVYQFWINKLHHKKNNFFLLDEEIKRVTNINTMREFLINHGFDNKVVDEKLEGIEYCMKNFSDKSSDVW